MKCQFQILPRVNGGIATADSSFLETGSMVNSFLKTKDVIVMLTTMTKGLMEMNSATPTTFKRIIPHSEYPNTWLISGVSGEVSDLMKGFTFNGSDYSFTHYCEVGQNSDGHTVYSFRGEQTPAFSQ